MTYAATREGLQARRTKEKRWPAPRADMLVTTRSASAVAGSSATSPHRSSRVRWSDAISTTGPSTASSGEHERGRRSVGCPPPGESPVEVGFDYRPAWSPDGTQIAFISYVGSGSDVFIMNAQAPTNAEGRVVPDGSRLASYGCADLPRCSPRDRSASPDRTPRLALGSRP